MKTSVVNRVKAQLFRKAPKTCAALLLLLTLGAGSWWTADKIQNSASRNAVTAGSNLPDRSAISPAEANPATIAPSATAAPILPTAPTAVPNQPAALGANDALWAVFDDARHQVQTLTTAEATLPWNKGVRYFAANPNQQLTARFLDNGARIESGAGGGWQGTMQATGLGRGSSEISLGAVTPPTANGPRVEYRRSGLIEWFVNRTAGIEHGFTLMEKPAANEPGKVPLRVTLRMAGLKAKQAGPNQIHWHTADDVPVLSYTELKVWDASHNPVQAEMKTDGDGVAILVADAGATYPLTIDPLIATLEQKLRPEITGSGAAEDLFGTSVALSGDTALVGMPGDDTAAGVDVGSAYVFVRTGSVWAFQARLTPNDALTEDAFGLAVALSDNTALVSTQRSNGIAFVFVRSGSAWTQQAMLAAGTFQEEENQVTSVAVQGNTALVGTASGESVYVYVRTGTNWTEQDEVIASDGMFGDHFGGSVALSGETMVVGAPQDSSDMMQVPGPPPESTPQFAPGEIAHGSAYVFVRSNGVWTEQQKLLASDKASFDVFGTAVSISGDTVLVGAPGDNTQTGGAYVFTRSNTSWTEQQKLTKTGGAANQFFGSAVAVENDRGVISAPATNESFVFERTLGVWSQRSRLIAGDATGSDGFGASVALAADTILIGTPFDDTRAGQDAGTAFVFVRADEACCEPEVGDGWCQQARLTAGDAAVNDHFGRPLALEGNTALIGALFDDSPAGTDTGAVYVFVRQGTVWSQQARLVALDAAAFDSFGWSVSIFGNNALIGALQDDTAAGANTGSAYIFTRNGTIWTQMAKLIANDAAADDSFGRSVSLGAGTAVIGAVGDNTPAGENAGSAYIFTGSGATWTQKTKLLASDGAPFDSFGQSLSLSGNTVLISAMGDDLGPTVQNAGSAYVFVRNGAVWSQQARLFASDCAANDFFGHAVALSGDTALIGADSADTPAGADAGAAYVFVRTGTSWSQQKKLTASDGAAGDAFGQRVALDGNIAAVTAPANDTAAGLNGGSAYVFTRDGTTWTEALAAPLTPGDGAENDFFGAATALSGNTLLVGADGDDGVDLLATPAPDQGSVYVFRLWLGNGPEIVVQQPLDNNLVDGSSTVEFGDVVRGNNASRTFHILSAGPNALTGINLTINGTNAGDFKVVPPPPPTTLDPGAMVPFTIVFTPGGTGLRQAQLHIASNDSDENPFDINLNGDGLPPEHPAITQDLLDRLVPAGTLVKYVAQVSGQPTPKIVWKRNGGAIPKATANTYQFVAALNLAGRYQFTATNPAGSVSSRQAELGVVDTSKKNLFECAGDTVSMVLKAAGNGLSFQWLKEGQPLMLDSRITVSADGKTLTIKNLVESDSATYACRVTGPSSNTLIGGTHKLTVITGNPEIIEPLYLPYGTVGAAYSFKIPVNPAPNLTPESFTATGLTGTGLSLNPTTGQISGIAIKAGNFNVTITAKNCHSSDTVQTYLYIYGLNCNVIGTYNGLVERDGCLNGGFGGTIVLNVTPLASFTGTLKLGPKSYPFSGKLVVPPNFGPMTAKVSVARKTPLGPVQLAFTLDPYNGVLTGTVTDPVCRLYKITDLAGNPGVAGSVNGTGIAALFDSPYGIARDSAGNFIVADTKNHLIRKVTPKGVVTTLAGMAGLCGSTDGPLAEALFNGPKGVAIDAAGNIYIADSGNSVVRCIRPQGDVITIAGTAGAFGSVDGTGAAARFVCLFDIIVDAAGNLIVSDQDDHTLRKITLPGAVVTTFAGKSNTPGSANGTGATARFRNPKGLALDADGRVIVADSGNHLIRRATATGAVTTLAGAPGVPGSSDGIIANARFYGPSDVAVDSLGNVFVADTLNNVLRRINSKIGIVSTVAGKAGTPGTTAGIGSAARFIAPAGLVAFGTTLAITDAGAHLVRLGVPSTAEAVPVLAYRNPWGTDAQSQPRTADATPKTEMGCYNPPATAFVGTYNLAFEVPIILAGNAAYPQGNGFITLTISSTGIVTWTGFMADGTPTMGTTALGGGYYYYGTDASEKTNPYGLLNYIPLHDMLYSDTGSMQGWQEIIADTGFPTAAGVAQTEPETLIDGEIDWMKIPEAPPQGRNYAAGIPLHLQFTVGEENKAPESGEIVLHMGPPPNNGNICFFEGGLNPDFDQDISVSTSNQVSVPSPNPNQVTFTAFNVSTSKYAGRFTLTQESQPAAKAVGPPIVRTSNFNGVFIRRIGAGVGYFLLNQLPSAGPPPTTLTTSPILSGQVYLQPIHNEE